MELELVSIKNSVGNKVSTRGKFLVFNIATTATRNFKLHLDQEINFITVYFLLKQYLEVFSIGFRN